MRPFGWALVQSNWDPGKRRKSRCTYTKKQHGGNHTGKKHGTQWKDSHLQAKDRGHSRNQTVGTFRLGLQTSRTGGKGMSAV